MTYQEYYWLADHHYVTQRSQHDKTFMSNEERSALREAHAAKVKKD